MSSKYQSVPPSEKFRDQSLSSDDQESILLDDDECPIQPAKSNGLNTRWLWLGHAVLFSLSFTMLVSAFLVRSSTIKHVREFSAWSPAAGAVEYKPVKFNNTMGVGSPYVGAGPAVDKEWIDITYAVGDQMISKDELAKIDMPDTMLKVKNPKTGAEGYRVGLEVFHQLHCVNLLRKVTYKDYYEPLGGDFAEGPEMLQMHTDHCLEILRMNVQCNADVGVFTLYMIDDDPLAWPELNSWHTCRNFDRVREWAMENSIGNMGVLPDSDLS